MYAQRCIHIRLRADVAPAGSRQCRVDRKAPTGARLDKWENIMATTSIPGTGQRPAPAPDALTRFARWLAQHSITALRISLGLVIAGFGALKFIPGASPAEALVMQTTEALTLGPSQAPQPSSSPPCWRRSSA